MSYGLDFPKIDSKTAGQGARRRTKSVNKPRWRRTAFTKAQRTQLEWAFYACQYPDIVIRETLSLITGLPESRIQVWFQNHRARYFRKRRLMRNPPLAPAAPTGHPTPSLPQFTGMSANLAPVPAHPCPCSFRRAPSGAPLQDCSAHPSGELGDLDGVDFCAILRRALEPAESTQSRLEPTESTQSRLEPRICDGS